MLHQTLTPPFVHFHPFSAPVSFAPPLTAAVLLHPPPPSPTSQPPLLLRSSQAEREARMEGVEEEVMRKACRAEAEQLQQPVFLLPDDVAWAVERGGFNGEDFSVDDLLDFNGLEAEKESDETEAFAFEAAENYKTCASTSSAVTFDAPPLAAINLPTHDAAEFEWMSSIIDDSPSEFPPCTGVPPYRPTTQSNTQLAPPPKTLCCTLSTEALVPVKAKRSKRPRTAGSAWPTVGVAALSDTTASTTTTTTTSSSPSSSSCSSSPSYSSYLVTNHVSFLFDANPPPAKKHQPKKRGRKPKNHHHHHHPPPQTAASAVAGFGERHCTHCGAQKTPQWRTGPLGPKTLCNACGVRFKSGRLMPEYRPAASPTFVSHVHSNSHRKVLEMRRMKEEHHSPPPHPSNPDPVRPGPRAVHFGPFQS